MKVAFSSVVILAVVLLAACAGAGADKQRIDQAEFAQAFKAGEVAIVDVRSFSAYTQGHIPGALYVNLEHVEQKAAELKALGKTIVTYCSCPAEESSLAAVMTMKRLGIKGARALVGGYQGWVGAGNPIVRGEKPLR